MSAPIAPFDWLAFLRVRRSVERDLRKRYADELAWLSEADQHAYLRREAARYALAFVKHLLTPRARHRLPPSP